MDWDGHGGLLRDIAVHQNWSMLHKQEDNFNAPVDFSSTVVLKSAPMANSY